MFATLNRFITRLDGSLSESGTENRYGFQVLRNTDPAVPVEPWFDFLIQVAGRDIDNGDIEAINDEIRACAGGSILVTIWSAKGRRTRSIYLPVPADRSTLGLTVQWENLTTTDFVWHVLEVTPGSPADKAGLIPQTDYVIDSPDGLLRSQTGLEDLVLDHMNRPLRLYVYNLEYDVVRPVTITPSTSWGGEGKLGCVLAYGILHRIPPPMEEPTHAPGETLFETDVHHPSRPTSRPDHGPGPSPYSNQVQVGQSSSGLSRTSSPFATATPSRSGHGTGDSSGPASLLTAQPYRPRKIRGQASTTTSGTSGMDAYLAQETERSRRLDHVVKTGSVKSGGPDDALDQSTPSGPVLPPPISTNKPPSSRPPSSRPLSALSGLSTPAPPADPPATPGEDDETVLVENDAAVHKD